MPENLTKRQMEVLDFINDFLKDHGYAPTIREIGDHFKLRARNGKFNSV